MAPSGSHLDTVPLEKLGVVYRTILFHLCQSLLRGARHVISAVQTSCETILKSTRACPPKVEGGRVIKVAFTDRNKTDSSNLWLTRCTYLKAQVISLPSIAVSEVDDIEGKEQARSGLVIIRLGASSHTLRIKSPNYTNRRDRCGNILTT